MGGYRVRQIAEPFFYLVVLSLNSYLSLILVMYLSVYNDEIAVYYTRFTDYDLVIMENETQS